MYKVFPSSPHYKSARYRRLETRRNGLRPMLSILPQNVRLSDGLGQYPGAVLAAVWKASGAARCGEFLACDSGRFWRAAKAEIICTSLDITWPEVMVILGVCFAVVGVAAALA